MPGERGFTLVELVTILIIMGILAAVAIPRMTSTDDFVARQFRDQVVATLRYAQKSAVSHRRLVCVSFTASTVSLRMASARGAVSCDQDLLIPGAGSSTLSSRNPGTAYFASLPPSFNIQADGTCADQAMSISGQPAITVAGRTGYVR